MVIDVIFAELVSELQKRVPSIVCSMCHDDDYDDDIRIFNKQGDVERNLWLKFTDDRIRVCVPYFASAKTLRITYELADPLMFEKLVDNIEEWARCST